MGDSSEDGERREGWEHTKTYKIKEHLRGSMET